MYDTTLTVTDTNADGHSVAIRLRTKTRNGSVHNWPWHKNTLGNGQTERWDGLHASDTNGIFYAGAEVAVFEKDDLLASCYTNWIDNPYAAT